MRTGPSRSLPTRSLTPASSSFGARTFGGPPTPDSFGVDTAALEVIVVAGRIDADAAVEQVETIVDAAIPALLAAGYRHQGVTPPAPLDIGGITYLTARIRINTSLPIGATSG